MNSAYFPPYEEEELPRISRRSKRLQRHMKRREETELNIVSMIDVFAVLVFFLLVGSSISAGRLHAVALDLPQQGTSVAEAKKPLQLTVSMFEDAMLVTDSSGMHRELPNIDGRYDRETLGKILSSVKRDHPDEQRLILRVAVAISYENIIQTMDVIRQAPGVDGEQELFPLISLGDVPVQGGA